MKMHQIKNLLIIIRGHTAPSVLWSAAPLPAPADHVQAGDDASVHHDGLRALPGPGVLKEGQQAQVTAVRLVVKLEGIAVASLSLSYLAFTSTVNHIPNPIFG